MKHLLLLLLFSGVIFGQAITGNPPQLPKIPQDPNGVRGSVLLNYDPVSGQYFSGKSRLLQLDSLSTGDTVKICYFGNKYAFGAIELLDSAGVTDTFYVEMYDTLNPYTSLIWRTNSAGLIDLVTNTMTPSTTGRYGLSSNGIIIPGSGVVRRYLINEPHPGTWRVWMPASVVSGKKRYIKWVGRN